MVGELASFRTVNYCSHDNSNFGRRRGGSSGIDALQVFEGVVGEVDRRLVPQLAQVLHQGADVLVGARPWIVVRVEPLVWVVSAVDLGVLARRAEHEMRDVGIDPFVADEGRGQLEQDAVVGEDRDNAEHIRPRTDRGRFAAGPLAA